MGITVHYRGTMDDVSLVEEMEDRVVDLAFALGGKATIWRSYSESDPTRIVRGLLVEMAAGQETLSLLVSPEGDLINLFEIEEAEKQAFAEPPYCFVKTQFGSVQGHVAVVALLDALKERYLSNLEISDESEYYAHRDPAILSAKMNQVSSAISALEDTLQHYGMSEEAAEDPEILAARIERVAQLVHDRIHQSGTLPGNGSDIENSDYDEPSLEEEVTEAERLHRRDVLRSERMTRRIEEARAQGMPADEALELALSEEGLTMPSGDDRPLSEEQSTEETWRESLPKDEFDDDCDDAFAEPEKRPVVAAAESLLSEFMEIRSEAVANRFVDVAIRGSMDLVGGLVQATSSPNLERFERAHAIVQLKRALKGHALARGAVFGLVDCQAIDRERSKHLHDLVESILESIHQLLAELWDESPI